MIEKHCTLVILCSFLLFSGPVFGMHVESYWESWVLKDYPNDWCALLEEVPASPIGSTKGANYVSIGIKIVYELYRDLRIPPLFLEFSLFLFLFKQHLEISQEGLEELKLMNQL